MAFPDVAKRHARTADGFGHFPGGTSRGFG